MLKLFAKLLLFVPVLAGMMYVSYTVDPAGLYQGADFERQVADFMLSGYNVRGYERLNGRELNEIYARKVPYSPQILVNGSSRVMLIDSSFAEGKTFYNAGNTGADIYDVFTGYYIFSKEGKEPEKFVLGIDPWIFNDDSECIDKRSDKELYGEFITTQLGYEYRDYQPQSPYEIYKALLEPSYFQSSVKYYQNGDENPAPEIIADDLVDSEKEVVKLPDGSISYGREFTNTPQTEKDFNALTLANAKIQRLYGFTELSQNYTRQFEDFIKYLQAKNIEIVLFIPPYHPYVYDTIKNNPDEYSGVLKAEEFINKIGEKYGISVIGSFNPDACNLTNTDFLDGLHLNKPAVRKLLGNL